jgi:hypothetical protein
VAGVVALILEELVESGFKSLLLFLVYLRRRPSLLGYSERARSFRLR